MQNQLAYQVSIISIFLNILLSLCKLAAGIFAMSGAMISDAMHSLSDVFSTFLVIASIKISGKEADKEHPYGHEKIESIFAFILAFFLATVGIGIGANGVYTIYTRSIPPVNQYHQFAVSMAVLSILIKEWMYHYTIRAARKINSISLRADAWHHRSDALSSVGSFAGLIGARLGFPCLDPVASIIICIFILKAAYQIARDAIRKLVDRACDEELMDEIKRIVHDKEGVKRIDVIKSRLFGAKIYVDIEIAVDGEQSLTSAHRLAMEIHNTIETAFPCVKHCMIHVNPYSEEPDHHHL